MKNRLTSIGIVFSIVIGGFFCLITLEPEVGNAITIYVGSGTGNDSATINGGIGLANDGDTVYVYNGIYHENVVVNKTINLTGENMDTTIIDGTGNGDVVYVSANRTNITGFTVTGCGSIFGDAGIELNNVRDCKIINNNVSSNNSTGISLYSSSNNTITGNNVSTNKLNGVLLEYSNDNHVTGNNASGNRIGVCISRSSNNKITDNNISKNEFGIFLYNSGNSTITSNNVFLNVKEGILLDYSSYISISFNNVQNQGTGISIWNSMYTTITYNNISNNYWGLRLEFSTEATIMHNTFTSDDIFISGNLLPHYNSHTITLDNLVNGKHLYYFKDRNTINIDGIQIGELIVVNCTDVRVTNLMINGTDVGIEMAFVENAIIMDNDLSNNLYGIRLFKSTTTTIMNNTIKNNRLNGIILDRCANNAITDNIISKNWVGIQIFEFSTNVTIRGNNVSNSECGIGLWSCNTINVINNIVFSNNQRGIDISDVSGIKIIGNYIFLNGWGGLVFVGANNATVICNYISNNGYGIFLWSTNFYIYHNNFVNNTVQAEDNYGPENTWNDSYPSGGNYWSDYSGVDNFKGPNQNIPGKDGIGDTNYSIDFDSIDHYPLLEPWRYSMVLKQGWNLISIPLIQEEQNLTRVLGSIDGWYDTVEWYDVTDPNDYWKVTSINKPFGNDFTEINETMGFWIHITKPGDTIFLYNGSLPTENQSITIYPGWNLIGYPSLSTRNRTDALNNIDFGTDVDSIWTYDARTHSWEEIGETNYFEIGRGYWIHSKVKKIWDVPL